ncbi:MAG: recombinase RecA [Planctomycetes bacterium]|nr:recombinase RecA [Planctomycetota bacterium]
MSGNSSSSGAGGANETRKQAVQDVVGQIEKQFGKGAIMRLGEGRIQAVSGISTGCLSLDLALGGVGIPRDRVTEIFGPESSGKTTLTLHCIANVQKQGGIAAFIDAEHALDPVYARKLGVDLDQLLVSQPDTGEQALEICEMLIRSGGVDMVVIDSVAALVPKAEIEGEMGDSHVGLQARLMSQALRKLTGVIAKSHCAVIFINQIREKIGVMFGNPETTTGGRALKFYSSVRIDIRRVGALKVGEETVGNRTKATVVKNKIAPPFRKTEFDILYNEGISYFGDLIDLASTHNVLEKSGTWFSFGALRLGQGRDKAVEFLRANKDVAAKVDALVREKLAPPVEPGAGGSASASGNGSAHGTANGAAAGVTSAGGTSSVGAGAGPRPAVAAAMRDGDAKRQPPVAPAKK